MADPLEAIFDSGSDDDEFSGFSSLSEDEESESDSSQDELEPDLAWTNRLRPPRVCIMQARYITGNRLDPDAASITMYAIEYQGLICYEIKILRHFFKKC